jgi:hypothetical protein
VLVYTAGEMLDQAHGICLGDVIPLGHSGAVNGEGPVDLNARMVHTNGTQLRGEPKRNEWPSMVEIAFSELEPVSVQTNSSSEGWGLLCSYSTRRLLSSGGGGSRGRDPASWEIIIPFAAGRRWDHCPDQTLLWECR